MIQQKNQEREGFHLNEGSETILLAELVWVYQTALTQIVL